MNRFNTALTLLCVAVLGCPVAAAAEGLFGDDTYYRAGPYSYFEYARQEDTAPGPNQHPVDLDAQVLTQVLVAMEFYADGFFADDDEFEPVFSPGQAERLGQQLARGLRNARPDQDITFTLEKKDRTLVILENRAIMTGRAFFQDGALNIIIGEYGRYVNKEFQRVYDTSGKVSPYRFVSGSRGRQSGSMKRNLLNFAGVTNKDIGGRTREDWFVIDLNIAYATVNQTVGPEAQGGAIAATPAAATEDDRQMRLEAARMKRDQRELMLEMARMRKQMQEMDPEAGGSESAAPGGGISSIEQRLTTLEALYERELISREEFEAKRKEILQDI